MYCLGNKGLVENRVPGNLGNIRPLDHRTMGMYCPRTLTKWDLGNVWYWENLVLSLFYCSQSLFNMLIAAVCFPGLLADVSWSVTADRRSALLTLYHNASWWHGKYSQTRGLLIVCLAKVIVQFLIRWVSVQLQLNLKWSSLNQQPECPRIWYTVNHDICLMSIDGLVSEGEFLDITEIKRQQAEDYECITNNGVAPPDQRKVKVTVNCKYSSLHPTPARGL